MPTPPVVAKRTSRYRGPVAPEDGTGVKFTLVTAQRISLGRLLAVLLGSTVPQKGFSKSSAQCWWSFFYVYSCE